MYMKGTDLFVTNWNVISCCKQMNNCLKNQAEKVKKNPAFVTHNCIRTNDECLGPYRRWEVRRTLDAGRDMTLDAVKGLF